MLALVLSFLSVFIAAQEYIERRISSRRLLTYGVQLSAPLLSMPIDADPQLRVMRRGKRLANPYVIELRLKNHSRQDLPSSDFDKANPLCLDLGTKIVTLLGSAFEPQGSPALEVTANGNVIEIAPGLIRKRMEIKLVALVEGPGVKLTCQSPLVNVEIKSEDQEVASSQKRLGLKRALGWATIALIIWWVIEQPENVGHVAHDIGAFLAAVAAGLGKFFSLNI